MFNKYSNRLKKHTINARPTILNSTYQKKPGAPKKSKAHQKEANKTLQGNASIYRNTQKLVDISAQ